MVANILRPFWLTIHRGWAPGRLVKAVWDILMVWLVCVVE